MVWLWFCGVHSASEIARRVGCAEATVRSFVGSPAFIAAYQRELPVMTAGLDELAKKRLAEVLMEAIELKIWLMRYHRNGHLRNKVANELIMLGKEAVQMGRGNVTELLGQSRAGGEGEGRWHPRHDAADHDRREPRRCR